MNTTKRIIPIKESGSGTTYAIVPKNQDSKNRTADQQIRDLKGKIKDGDDIIVSPQAVNEEEEKQEPQQIDQSQREVNNSVEDEKYKEYKAKRKPVIAQSDDPFIQYFIMIAQKPGFDKGSGIRLGIGKLRKLDRNLPVSSLVRLYELYKNNEEYMVDMDRFEANLITILKIMGKETPSGLPALIDIDDVSKITDFIATWHNKKFIDEWKSYQDNEGNFKQKQTGEGSGQKRSGVYDYSQEDKPNELQRYLEYLKGNLLNGKHLSLQEKELLLQKLLDNRTTYQKYYANNKGHAQIIKLKRELKQTTLDKSVRAKLEKTLADFIKEYGDVEEKDVAYDNVDSNLLLTVAALSNDTELVDNSFKLLNNQPTLDSIGRDSKGKFQKTLKNSLLNNDMVSNPMKEHLKQVFKNYEKQLHNENRTFIMTDRQVGVLKEHFIKTMQEGFTKKQLIESVINEANDGRFKYRGYLVKFDREIGEYEIYNLRWDPNEPVFSTSTPQEAKIWIDSDIKYS